jgi:putative membrane protein
MKDSTISRIIIAISIAVPLLVTLLFFISPPDFKHQIDLSFFPKLNAILNSLVSICIISGFYFIKNKNVIVHRNLMLTAFLLSSIFLVSYITYHTLSDGSTKYGDSNFDGNLDSIEMAKAGMMRYVYYFILLTHIILAALILPLILFTFSKAITGKIIQHRKLAKWTFPLWLYVSVTGVLVYVMISPYYAH